jgi:hypothetical protein
MEKTIPLLLITFILSASFSYASLDTSPYTRLLDEISAKEGELEEARSGGDYGGAYTLRQELEGLKIQLDSSESTIMRLYLEVEGMINRAVAVVDQIKSIFSSTSKVGQLEEGIANVRKLLELAEEQHKTGDFSSALRTILNARDQISTVLSSGMVSALESIDKLEEELRNSDYLSPSLRSILDDARSSLNEAKSLYERAREVLMENKTSESNELFNRAYEIANSAFMKVERARDLAESDPIEWMIRLLLIAIPLMLVFFLVVYFYRRFNRATIRSTVSKTNAKAQRITEIKRTISITNLEGKEISAVVKDALPRALRISTTYTPPKQQFDNSLSWELELQPNEKKSISYTFIVPKLEAGWIIKIKPAMVEYLTGEKKKTFLSKSTQIRIE